MIGNANMIVNYLYYNTYVRSILRQAGRRRWRMDGHCAVCAQLCAFGRLCDWILGVGAPGGGMS